MMQIHKNKIWFLIAILTIPVPSLFWLPADNLLAHGPIYPWPDPSALLKIAEGYLFSWIDSSGFGSLNTEPAGFLYFLYAALITKVAGSSPLGQALFFYLGFVGCIGGMFLLARTLGFTPVASLVAGVFYLLSPVVFSGMPFEIVNIRLVPYHVATPIFLSIIVRAVNLPLYKKELAILGIVSIFLCSAGYSSLQYFVLNLILLSVYIIFAIIAARPGVRKQFKIIRRSFTVLTVMFLANFYWLSPMLFNLCGAYASRAEPGYADADLLRGLSVKLVDGFRMLPYPDQASISPWIAHYYTTIMTLVTFSFTALGGFAFLSRRTRHFAMFPGLLLIVALFLAKGTKEPLGFLGKSILFFHPYVTRLFRNPGYFELLVVLSLSLLVGLAVGELIRISSTQSLKASIIAVGTIITLTGIYGQQFIIGGAFRSQPVDGPSQFNEVPNYYKELVHFLCSDSGIYRINSIPTFTRQDWFVAYRWDQLFLGGPFLNLWSGKPVLRPLYPLAPGKVNSLFDAAIHPHSNIISQDTWLSLLRIATVRYVTFHKDTDWESLRRYGLQLDGREIHKFVTESPYLNKVKIFGEVELYELDTNLLVSKIYAFSPYILIAGEFNALAFLPPTPYLEGHPALAFTDQQSKDSLQSIVNSQQPAVNSQILLANGNFDDFVIDLAKTESQSSDR